MAVGQRAAAHKCAPCASEGKVTGRAAAAACVNQRAAAKCKQSNYRVSIPPPVTHYIRAWLCVFVLWIYASVTVSRGGSSACAGKERGIIGVADGDHSYIIRPR